MLEKTEEEQVLEILVRNQLEIKRLQEENDKLKSFFKGNEAAYPVGRREVGKFYIQVTENKRVDDKLARSVLPGSDYKLACKTVIDSTFAKRVLTEDQYASIQKKFENKIEVGLI